MIGLSGAGATVGVQVGYSIADVLAKAAFGIFIYNIALKKTHSESAARQPRERDALLAI